MGLTDKQKSILTKNGYDLQQVNAMTYEQASALIGGILQNRQSKAVEFTKPTQAKAWDKPKQDQTSFKVAYAKDLLIAQIEFAGMMKNDKFDIMSAHQLSVQIIGAMWDVFKE